MILRTILLLLVIQLTGCIILNVEVPEIQPIIIQPSTPITPPKTVYCKLPAIENDFTFYTVDRQYYSKRNDAVSYTKALINANKKYKKLIETILAEYKTCLKGEK